MRDINVFLIAGVGVMTAAGMVRPASALEPQRSNRVKTISCAEKTTRVDGMNQQVRLTGDCQVVVVTGSGNRVVIERLGSVNVSGMNNDVRWERSLQGDAPQVANSGLQNSVAHVPPTETLSPSPAPAPTASAPAPAKPPSTRPASPAPRTAAPAPPPPTRPAEPSSPASAGGQLVVDQSGQTLRMDCASRTVTVSGNTNNIELTGSCGQLSISGSGNTITVERAPRIVSSGHNNKVTWEFGAGDKPPVVRSTGMNNTVTRASR